VWFAHLILIHHLHRSEGFSLHVVPLLNDAPRGVFSTRAPRRPNPVELSVVELQGIREGRLTIRNADILDGTTLLDIKRLVPQFDQPAEARIGWMEKMISRTVETRSENRFL
jgi:tRNA (Thr-GGU) A37 N-methylase